MKTPLFVLFLLAPLHPAALGCDNSDCPSTTSVSANKSTAAPVVAKPAATAAHAPAATTPTPPAEKPRRAPGSRRPAYLFM